MNDDPFSPQTSHNKEALERAKIEREIAELTKPLFKRPAFWGVLGPVLIAAVYIFADYYSGKLDAEHTLLQSEKNLLEAQQIKLTSDKEKLLADTAQLVAERAAMQTEVNNLTTERDDAQTALEEITAAANAEIDALETNLRDTKEELATERQNLDDAQTAFARRRNELQIQFQREEERLEEERRLAIVKHEAELIELRENAALERSALLYQIETIRDALDADAPNIASTEKLLRLAPIRADIASLETTSGAIWQQDAMERLIKLAATDEDVVGLVEEAFDATDNHEFASGLLYLLYQARPTEANLARFFDYVAANSDDPSTIEILGGGYWTPEVEERALNLAFELAAENKISSEAMKEFSFLFGFSQLAEFRLGQLLSSEKARPFLIRALETFQNGGLHTLEFYFLTRAFATIDPNFAAVVAGLAYLELPENERHHVRLQLETEVLEDESPSFASAMTDTGFLGALKAGSAEKWLSDHPDPTLVDAVINGDLDQALSRVNGD